MSRVSPAVCVILLLVLVPCDVARADAKNLAKAAALAFEYDPKQTVDARTQRLQSPSGYSLEQITLKPAGEGKIPLLLAMPEKRSGPVPVVILLHGLGGNKRQMVDYFARRLAAKGMASLALDLDGHGDRETPSNDFPDKLKRGDLLGVGIGITRSVVDGRRVIDYAASRRELDAGNVAVMGYSLGSCVGCVLANVDSRVRGLVMTAGGTSRQLLSDLDKRSTVAAFSRMYRPTVHAPGIAPRPVLMINGRNDRVFLPADAMLLFKALGTPKKLVWYKGDHELPARAATTAVQWLQRLLLEE